MYPLHLPHVFFPPLHITHSIYPLASSHIRRVGVSTSNSSLVSSPIVPCQSKQDSSSSSHTSITHSHYNQESVASSHTYIDLTHSISSLSPMSHSCSISRGYNYDSFSPRSVILNTDFSPHPSSSSSISTSLPHNIIHVFHMPVNHHTMHTRAKVGLSQPRCNPNCLLPILSPRLLKKLLLTHNDHFIHCSHL